MRPRDGKVASTSVVVTDDGEEYSTETIAPNLPLGFIVTFCVLGLPMFFAGLILLSFNLTVVLGSALVVTASVLTLAAVVLIILNCLGIIGKSSRTAPEYFDTTTDVKSGSTMITSCSMYDHTSHQREDPPRYIHNTNYQDVNKNTTAPPAGHQKTKEATPSEVNDKSNPDDNNHVDVMKSPMSRDEIEMKIPTQNESPDNSLLVDVEKDYACYDNEGHVIEDVE